MQFFDTGKQEEPREKPIQTLLRPPHVVRERELGTQVMAGERQTASATIPPRISNPGESY